MTAGVFSAVLLLFLWKFLRSLRPELEHHEVRQSHFVQELLIRRHLLALESPHLPIPLRREESRSSNDRQECHGCGGNDHLPSARARFVHAELEQSRSIVCGNILLQNTQELPQVAGAPEHRVTGVFGDDFQGVTFHVDRHGRKDTASPLPVGESRVRGLFVFCEFRTRKDTNTRQERYTLPSMPTAPIFGQPSRFRATAGKPAHNS